jgi:hypothetical protein
MDVCEAIEKAREYGDWVEVEEVLVEDLETIEGWDDYSTLLHEDIPNVLKRIFKECGVELLGLYHLKDDVALPEYVAEVRIGNETYAIELDVDIDTEAGEVTLLAVRACYSTISGLLPYYHMV